MDTGGRGDRVLVTGGSGYLGGWLLAALLERGYAVRTTVRSEAAGELARAMAGGPVEVHFADLTADEGWERAAAGCRYVLHAAAPLGAGAAPGTDLAGPIIEGTRRVLAASHRARVERVVLTSSLAAALGPPGGPPADEHTWTDPAAPGLSAYTAAKTRAEQLAWEFARQAGYGFALTALLPGFLLGPVRAGAGSESVAVVARMWRGALPLVPRIGFSVVDVRDVAALHVRALGVPAAAGHRFLLAGHFAWLSEMGGLLDARVRTLPDPLVRLLAPFHRELRYIAPQVGVRREWNAAKAADLLGWRPRPLGETLLDCARSLL